MKQARIAVINFSGNVGKTTVSRHLLLPRVEGADYVPVESINADESLPTDIVIRGKQFDQLQDALQVVDSMIIDIGASNVEELMLRMKQSRGSHVDCDMFVVPVVKETKQQKDTIATIDALAALGVPAKKIKIVFDKVDLDETVEAAFAPILAYIKAEKKAVANPAARIDANEVYEKIKGLHTTLKDLLADETDYKAKVRETKDDAEKALCLRMIAAKRLAYSAVENLDTVFEVITK